MATNKNIIEVVAETQIESTESKMTTSQNRMLTLTKQKHEINSSQSLNNSKTDKLRTVLNYSDANISNEGDKSNTTIKKNDVEVIIEKSASVSIHNPFAENKTSTEVLAADALNKIQKKPVVSSKENPAKETNGFCSLVSQENIIINKDLSVAGPCKNIKSVYTILDNAQVSMLRKHALEAAKLNKVFTIRGNYNSIRYALKNRGWVEKLEIYRKSAAFASSHHATNICDLSQALPKRKTGETQLQFMAKVEGKIISRCIENVLCDFLWTPHKEKADHWGQSKKPNMLINKLNRTPFTNKENLNAFLRDIDAFYEEGVIDIKFPRCFNVWSPEELSEFIDNFKLTACIAFIHWLVDKYNGGGFDAVFSPTGQIPFNSIDFAFKRCLEFMEVCQHNDIDGEDSTRIWEHDWDAFLHQHYQITHDGFKIIADTQKLVEVVIVQGSHILENIQYYWPQYAIDGYHNLWIIKPANKCRGRGIHLSNNLKKIINFVNPSIATKSRFVVQKYMERPLIIHQTKFDIRQWFLISSISPLTIWMYKECYLRFSSQEYTLINHHESVHLTNHAIQKKYTNSGRRDKNLPYENMWDSYSFQAYLRQIGKQELWLKRIYPGMRNAIVAAVLVSQDHMERTSNTFELFGADFMICENFYPWLIEINSNPDLGATTSVTARMCPQCLEDVIKVVIDRRNDSKADVGSFEMIYRQNIPPTPAYMGLNLIVKGKQIANRTNGHPSYMGYQRKEKSPQTKHSSKKGSSPALTSVSQVHRTMPAFNATEYVEKYITEMATSSPRIKSVSSLSVINEKNIDSLAGFISLRGRSKSINSQTKISCIKSRDWTILKRYCSSAPRFSTHCIAPCKDSEKSESLISYYNQQKILHSIGNVGCTQATNFFDTTASTISKSLDNIRELYSPLKKTNPIVNTKRNITNSKKELSFRLKLKSQKKENNVNTIHAIGISICSLNSK